MQTSESIYTDHRKQNARLWQAILITAVVFLVLLGGVWIWKSLQIKTINRNAENYRTLVAEQAARQIRQVQEEQLKSMAKPLVWALRTEMMKGNMDKVNLYLEELVKERNVQRVVVSNNKGKIVAATDKKNIGKPLSSVAESVDSKTNETLVNQMGDSTLIMTSPIMGFNNRLGTVLVEYTPSPLAL